MLDDGLVARFGIEEFFGLHNMPGLPAGQFGIKAGGIMAASDKFEIVVEGKGGHAALPHNTVDPVMISAQIIMALQTIVSRSVDPLREAVVTVTMVEAGTAFNIVPRTARLTGTARSLDEDVRDLVEAKIASVAEGIATAFGASAKVTYSRGYPVTMNAPEQTDFAAQVARDVTGAERVDAEADATMGGEDFAYMLQARPGAYIFLGNGDSSQLHTDTYDFNDAIIPVGVSYWARLVECALPAT
jgi:hippurate hydrolase